MFRKVPVMLVLVSCLSLAAGCGGGSSKIAEYPLDDLEGLLENSLDEFSIDKANSHDGGGSLHFFVDSESKWLLFDVPVQTVRNDQIVWRARVKTQSLFRDLFFEFVLYKADGSARFEREFCKNVKRFSDWVTVDAVLDLQPGEVPEKLRLIVYANGSGKVWIDEIEVWDGRPPAIEGAETGTES